MGTFIKKYWKMVITALVCIVVILLLSYVTMMGRVAFYTIRTNNAQKSQIILNVESSIRFYENRRNILHRVRLDIIRKLSEIIYKDDADFDQKLLSEYCSEAGVEDIIILDSDRAVTHTLGCKDYTLSKKHFRDPYYDNVFSDADLKSANSINIIALKDYDKDALFIKAKEGYWVYIFPEMEDEKAEDRSYFWQIVLENVWVGDYSDIGVVDSSSKEIIYSWDDSLEGNFVELDKNGNYIGEINDKVYYVSTIHSVEDESANVVAFTPVLEVTNMIKDQLITIAVLIIVAITIMISLIIFLREDEIDAREEFRFLKKYFLKIQLKKYAIVGLAGSLILAAELILVSELDYMTNLEEDMSLHIDKSVKLFDDFYEDGIAIGELVEGRYYAYGRIADTFLTHHPEYVTKEGLGYLADVFEVSAVTLFDAEGKTISTSSPLDHLSILSDEESPLYDLRYALIGKEEVSVGADERVQPADITVFAVPSRDEKGATEGIVAIETVVEDVERAEPRGLLSDRSGVIQFCVDEEGKILIFHDNKQVGKNISSTGISPDMIYDGYSGKHEYEGKYYAALVKSSKAGYTVLISQYNSFAPEVVGNGLISAILFVIAAVIFAYDGLGSIHRFVSRPPKGKELKKGGKEEKCSELNVGEKMKKVIDFYIYCFSAYFIICQLMIFGGSESHDTIDYIFNGDWSRSVNIFSVVCNVFLIMIYYSVIRWFEAILTRVAAISGPSGETISRLIDNIIKYLGTIICLCQIVMNFGVDAKATLTSLGIVGFGLTFGAQDMVKDIIAGIFIFFEGSYKVGDKLLIGGDTYWVKSIGIRTTRVEAAGKERVINNSQMSDVVNIRNSPDDE